MPVSNCKISRTRTRIPGNLKQPSKHIQAHYSRAKPLLQNRLKMVSKMGLEEWLQYHQRAIVIRVIRCNPYLLNDIVIERPYQGAQFTSRFWIDRLQAKEISSSLDGKGRALDNLMIERLWHSLKYEDIYLKGYETGSDCYKGLVEYSKFYSHERPHQSLDFRTPWDVHTSFN